MKQTKPRRRRLLFELLEPRRMLSGGRPLPPGIQGNNVALGRSYTWNVAPNASGCTDSGDATQLTDGQYSAGEFWTQSSTVGWQDYANPVEITIDLGVVQPIQGVSYSTAGGVAGVQWPTAINVKVSNDNIQYYDVADLVALDPNPPVYGTYATHRYLVTDQLATHGRYVRFQVVESPSVFVDEIEVYRGANSLLGQNISLACPYTLSPAPNYPYCTEPGDATQLTDGVYTNNYFWTQASTVGWMRPNTYAQIRIDLGTDQPIEGVSFNTAAGVAGVTWPTTIGVLVSTDGVNFYDAGEVTRLSMDHGLPPATPYLIRSYWTDRLVTHGRYVKIVPADSPYLFVDEIEIYRGRNEMLSAAMQGPPITDVAAYVASSQLSSLGVRRIVTDAQNVQQQVDATSQLTPAQQAQYDAQLKAVIAQAMYDYPAQVILPVDDLHRQVFAVQAAMWHAQGFADLTAWTTSSAWDQVGLTSPPPTGNSPSISVTAMPGEFRAEAFNLSNATQSDMDLRLTIAGLPGGTNPSYIRVQQVEWNDTRGNIPVLAALPDASFDTAQGAFLIHVPRGMTRQVWLTFHPRADTGPGTFTGTIVVDGAGTLNVPIQLRVAPLAFPAQPMLGLGGWDYTNTTYGQVTTANCDAFIATLTEHFVDTTWATNAVMPATPNFTQFDAWVARWPNAREYRVFSNVGATFGGYQMGTLAFNQAVGTWISAYVAHWRQIGIDPSHVGLALVDEPHASDQSDRIVAWANAIKAAEPDVLIWEDPTWSNPADGTATFDVSDVLSPQRPMFLSGNDAFRNVYRQERDAGKTLNFYSCSGPTEQLDPYSYYRLQAWTLWDEWGRVKDGPTAMFYWAFSDQGGASNWRTSYGTGDNYTPLFLDPNAVTDGKDMESIREGVEDYEYLRMLKDRIAELEARGIAASALVDAKNLLASAPTSVLGATGAANLYWNSGKDRTVADGVRIQVLNMLETLDRLPGPVVTAGQITISGATGSGGAYRIGDTVTAAWNDTATGDHNAYVVDATVDFSQFGGGSTVPATNNNGTWTASYGIVAGTIDAANCNVSLSATDDAGHRTTTTDDANARVDNIRPQAAVLSPPGGATDAAVDGNLVITFSETVAKGAGSVVIKKADDNSAVETIAVGGARVTIAGPQVTIDPVTTLASGAHYYVQIDAGTFVDQAGNACAGINDTTSWSFTTLNLAPVLDNSGTMSLAGINEDDTSNGGTLVSAVIDSAGADRITDADAWAVEGIAVTAVQNANGTWQYKLGAGAWTDFGDPSPTAARLLTSDAGTWVRFVPNALWYGTVTGGITFRAWDQTSGAAGGTADTTTNGGNTAFSAAVATASIAVNHVNHPPVIASLAGAPDPVELGQNVILTASGVADPDTPTGSLTNVAFYRESNGTPGLQTGFGGDALVGVDNDPSGGWAVSVASAGLTPGIYAYYAQATDNEGGTSPAGTAATSTSVSVRITYNLDADANGRADALTDGILILRYLFDPAGAWNYSDALGSGAARTTRPAIKSFLDGGRNTVLDVDGNGTPDALTDGILILRYLFDPAGAWNYSDALGSGATRTTRATIKAYLDQYNPGLAPTPGPTAAGIAAEPVVQADVDSMIDGSDPTPIQTIAGPSPATVDIAKSVWYFTNANQAGNAEAVVGFGAPNSGWRNARGSSDQGTGWKTLGTFNIIGNQLVVTLSDNAMRTVVADAIRIERVNPLAVDQIDLAAVAVQESGLDELDLAQRDLSTTDGVFAADPWDT